MVSPSPGIHVNQKSSGVANTLGLYSLAIEPVPSNKYNPKSICSGGKNISAIGVGYIVILSLMVNSS